LLLTADSSLISGSESSSNVTSAELPKAYHDEDHQLEFEYNLYQYP
jgi:hypothetical protein